MANLNVSTFESCNRQHVAISTPCAEVGDDYSHASSAIIMSIEIAEDLHRQLSEKIAAAKLAVASLPVAACS